MPARSHSSACGASSFSAKVRTVFRNASCSSVKGFRIDAPRRGRLGRSKPIAGPGRRNKWENRPAAADPGSPLGGSPPVPASALRPVGLERVFQSVDLGAREAGLAEDLAAVLSRGGAGLTGDRAESEQRLQVTAPPAFH